MCWYSESDDALGANFQNFYILVWYKNTKCSESLYSEKIDSIFIFFSSILSVYSCLHLITINSTLDLIEHISNNPAFNDVDEHHMVSSRKGTNWLLDVLVPHNYSKKVTTDSLAWNKIHLYVSQVSWSEV